MSERAFALFDTAIGRCAIAWGAGGIVGLHLPEASQAQTRARVHRRFGAVREAAPPEGVQRAIEAVQALLRGERSDLSRIELDMQGIPAFHCRVYGVARGIAPGETLTYGEVAARLGEPGAARAVGQALGANPFALIVPCHRVLAAGGRAGGFSAHGGAVMKRRLLEIEQALAPQRLPLFERAASP